MEQFACPVCGRIRQLSPYAAKAIARGTWTGRCRDGEGCRVALDEAERFRRWWLHDVAGIDEVSIARSGGAGGYVVAHGLPEMLHALAGVLPRDVPLVTNPRSTSHRDRPSRRADVDRRRLIA